MRVFLVILALGALIQAAVAKQGLRANIPLEKALKKCDKFDDNAAKKRKCVKFIKDKMHDQEEEEITEDETTKEKMKMEEQKGEEEQEEAEQEEEEQKEEEEQDAARKRKLGTPSEEAERKARRKETRVRAGRKVQQARVLACIRKIANAEACLRQGSDNG